MNGFGSGMVVIGASLGGLQAVSEVLRALPADFPLPVAIAQHRSAAEPETLARLLRRSCRLPVREPSDKEVISPGTCYLAPADYHLIVEGGEFALSTGPPVSYARPSIDVLFESAVEIFGRATIGVVLTGANMDGSAGAQAVKSRGGVLIVQDPATAECSVMPRAALQSATPDHVLPLLEIGPCLVERCIGRSRATN